MLIDGMTQKFDASAFHDRFLEELIDLVEKRAEGKAPVTHAAPKAKTTNVVDLAEVPQRSLEAHAKSSNGSGKRAGAGAGAANDDAPSVATTRKGLRSAPAMRRRPARKTASSTRRRST